MRKRTIYFRLNQAEFEVSRLLPHYADIPAFASPDFPPLQTACAKVYNMNYWHITRFSVEEGQALYQYMKNAGSVFQPLIDKINLICQLKAVKLE
jgi:hypothetical protein